MRVDVDTVIQCVKCGAVAGKGTAACRFCGGRNFEPGRGLSIGELAGMRPVAGAPTATSLFPLCLASFLSTVIGVITGWGIVLLMTRNGWWLPWR